MAGREHVVTWVALCAGLRTGPHVVVEVSLNSQGCPAPRKSGDVPLRPHVLGADRRPAGRLRWRGAAEASPGLHDASHASVEPFAWRFGPISGGSVQLLDCVRVSLSMERRPGFGTGPGRSG